MYQTSMASWALGVPASISVALDGVITVLAALAAGGDLTVLLAAFFFPFRLSDLLCHGG
jgi:hypothetical protein